ncbi:hypothetical protein [Terriglobus sp.]|uniref:hypothetical protein n=1 Tax=Terriglobus sp. TaxID=1889013 RepID=UPI003B00AF0C
MPVVPLPFGVVEPPGFVPLFGSVVLFGAEPLGVTVPLFGVIVSLGEDEFGLVPFIMEPFVVDVPLFMSEPFCMSDLLCLWCLEVCLVVVLPVAEPFISVLEPCCVLVPGVVVEVCA